MNRSVKKVFRIHMNVDISVEMMQQIVELSSKMVTALKAQGSRVKIVCEYVTSRNVNVVIIAQDTAQVTWLYDTLTSDMMRTVFKNLPPVTFEVNPQRKFGTLNAAKTRILAYLAQCKSAAIIAEIANELHFTPDITRFCVDELVKSGDIVPGAKRERLPYQSPGLNLQEFRLAGHDT